MLVVSLFVRSILFVFLGRKSIFWAIIKPTAPLYLYGLKGVGMAYTPPASCGRAAREKYKQPADLFKSIKCNR